MALLFGRDERDKVCFVNGTGSSLSEDGFTMQGDINMAGNKITGLSDPSTDTEPVTKGYADTHYSSGGAGGALQGPKGDKGDTGQQGAQGPKGDKGDKGDTGLHGLDGDDGAQGSKGDKGDTGQRGPRGPAGTGGLSNSGFNMTGDIDMGGNKITSLPTPTSDSEPATKKYSDDKYAEKADALTSHGFVMKDGHGWFCYHESTGSIIRF